ncbi:625_t:CDS:2, partial [Paraglomus occultum]
AVVECGILLRQRRRLKNIDWSCWGRKYMLPELFIVRFPYGENILCELRRITVHFGRFKSPISRYLKCVLSARLNWLWGGGGKWVLRTSSDETAAYTAAAAEWDRTEYAVD